MDFLLFALTPPGDVKKEISRLQQKLYTAWGLVSPLALPPLVPLIYVPADCTIPAKEKIKRIADPGPFALTTNGFVDVEGHLFWEVGSSGNAKQLAEAIKSSFPHFIESEVQKLFPVFEGFFLSSCEGLSSLKQVIKTLPPPQKLHFPGYTLSLLRMQTLSSEPLPHNSSDSACRAADSAWWEGIQWEEVITIALKKLKKTG